MFTMRVFYLKATGDVIYWMSLKGDFRPTVDAEWDAQPALEPYRNNKNAVGIIEWQDENTAPVEDCIASNGRMTVNVNANPPELVIDTSPLPEVPYVDPVDLALDMLEGKDVSEMEGD